MERRFFQDVMDIAFDSIDGNVEALGDFLIAETIGNENEDFPFAFGHGDRSGRPSLPSF